MFAVTFVDIVSPHEIRSFFEKVPFLEFPDWNKPVFCDRPKKEMKTIAARSAGISGLRVTPSAGQGTVGFVAQGQPDTLDAAKFPSSCSSLHGNRKCAKRAPHVQAHSSRPPHQAETRADDSVCAAPTHSPTPQHRSPPAPPMRQKLSTTLTVKARRVRRSPPPAPRRTNRRFCVGDDAPRPESLVLPPARAATVRRRLPLHRFGAGGAPRCAGASAQASGDSRATSAGGAGRQRSRERGDEPRSTNTAALAAACASLAECKRDRDTLAATLAACRARFQARVAGLRLYAELSSARAALAVCKEDKEGLVVQLVRLRREHAAARAASALGGAAGSAGERRRKAGRKVAADARADVAAATTEVMPTSP